MTSFEAGEGIGLHVYAEVGGGHVGQLNRGQCHGQQKCAKYESKVFFVVDPGIMCKAVHRLRKRSQNVVFQMSGDIILFDA